MEIGKARNLLRSATAKTRDLLKLAHERYMRFAGLNEVSGEYAAEVQADRVEYRVFLKFDEDGAPYADGVRCATFMVMVSGLPYELCVAWDEVDFARCRELEAA